ncbi:hypothetical protein U1Q18_025837, partial [Sarracenia purpurea var. burkii]
FLSNAGRGITALACVDLDFGSRNDGDIVSVTLLDPDGKSYPTCGVEHNEYTTCDKYRGNAEIRGKLQTKTDMGSIRRRRHERPNRGGCFKIYPKSRDIQDRSIEVGAQSSSHAQIGDTRRAASTLVGNQSSSHAPISSP